MTNPTSPDGGYRFTPAEIQQQLIQCTDLLRKFETSYRQMAGVISFTSPPALDTEGSVIQAKAVADLGTRASQRVLNQASFLHNWYNILIRARARYVEQEHLTEAQWNALAQDGLPE